MFSFTADSSINSPATSMSHHAHYPPPTATSPPPSPLLEEDEVSPEEAYAFAAQRAKDEQFMPETRDGMVSVKSGGARVSEEDSEYELAARYGYGGRYEDQARSDARSEASSAFDENGRRIERMVDGGPMDRQQSADEKMMADLELLGENPGMPGFEYEDDEEDSPYPEVRASVSNYDDVDIPVLTFRSWLLGLGFASIVGGLNSFLNLRYPTVYLTPIIIQVVTYPLGKILAYVLPDRVWRAPRWAVRLGLEEEWSFNPGPFNIKEHTIILIMANAASSPAYALNYSTVVEKYYGIEQGVGLDILLVLTTQMIGFGVAGLCRRFLVYPASLIWPQNLVYCTLLNTLHAEDDTIDGGGGISRYSFFKWATIAAFVYYFLPGFLFTALSAFSFICWAVPNNAVVNQLFGVSSGLGMSMITFDWSQISYIGSPLVVPWWAEVNIFVGFVITFWIIAPIMYYTNVWYSAYLPISTSAVFDRFGQSYNTSAVVDIANMALNVTAYESYSPLFLPVTYSAVYGLAMASTTAFLTHTILYHGKEIMARMRNAKSEPDIHMKLMMQYPEVPEWWYMTYLAVFSGMSIALIYVWDVQTPIWALIVSLLLGFVYVLPGGFVYAMTSQEIGINLLVELMAGYMLPGQPLGNMIFKTYSLQSIGYALTFVQDLKLGHYLKVPPRATFWAQIIASICSCLVQVGVRRWVVRAVPDLCATDQSSFLTCPYAEVMYSASIIWGLIGPSRTFGIGQLYNPVLWWFLAGGLLPIIFWVAGKRWPTNHVLQLVNIPVMMTGALFMPPASGINYSSWFFVGFLFQYLARRKFFRWWAKFNFIFSAALDCGTVISTIMIFLCLQLPKNGTIAVNWWGNDVYTKTADWAGVPYLTPPEEGFGPATW
ncbi:proton-dependent oligopeptide transporter, POT family [Pseudohyphozyma bogoriensis]|nr:proton-dependent oligopeptide transporter, POT family [Pseudohyphozyma bogoriensis]KAI5478853.1 proton-dependent oligopeptide transporter, POT family [Pseudohyphozyma bogoriensis]